MSLNGSMIPRKRLFRSELARMLSDAREASLNHNRLLVSVGHVRLGGAILVNCRNAIF
jgi:hypothetical protein